MDQDVYGALVMTGGQSSPKIVAPRATPTNRQDVPSGTPKSRRRPFNRKGQPCKVCRQVNCHNGNLCGNDHALSQPDPVAFPTNTTRRPSIGGHQEGPPRQPRTKRAPSLTTNPSTPANVPQKPQKPRNTRKVSDPLTTIPRPNRPPSRTGAPDHPGGRKFPPPGPPHERGRRASGPPTVPIPQQRRATSRSSVHEQDPTLPQPPLRWRRPCREWLKGNCPEGPNCPFLHDPEAQAAEELRLKKAAEERAAKIAQEAAATTEETVLHSTKVTFCAGATVQRVLTGYEGCRVLVKNLPLTATRAEVVTLFTQPGFNRTKFTVYPPRGSNDRSSLEAVVEFEDVADGKNAVAGLDDIEFGSTKLKLVLISKRGGMGKSRDLNSYILTVTWSAPSDIVFASYSSMDEANSKRIQLEKETFNGRKVRTNIAKKPSNLPDSVSWNPATISVSGLEPGASLTSIEEFCGTTCVRRPTRNTRSYDLNDAIPSLQSLVAGAHPENHQLLTYEPNLIPNERSIVSVKIHFPTWEHAKVVRDFLEQKTLPLCSQVKLFVSLPDPLQYTICVPHPQFKAQEKLFQSLIPAQNDRSATTHLRILAHRADRPARIELSGSDRKTIGGLKVRIEQLIAGEKLPQWDRLFYGAEGEKFLEKVNNESRAYIRADKRQCVLRAFGEPSAVEHAKTMIQEEMDRLASLQFEVILKRASVRFFMDGARGSTLLKQEVGEGNVTLDVSSTPCKIVVRGGELARQYLRKLIDESVSDALRSQHQLKDGETCPVCYDTIDHPHRLACGHAYCNGCLHHFLLTASDTKQFPLTCIGDEGKCSLPIPLPVIQRFLLPAQFKHLLEVSFSDHLARNPEKFRYCATPDCPEIYSLESDSGGGIFQCRSCFVSICVSCGEDHNGFSCEEWMIHRDPETQERLLEGWAEGNKDVKKCPKCKLLIEKNGGCNHMTCPKCDAHICWRCMGVFPSGEIYNHMELVHGGMLDGDELGGFAFVL